MKGHPMAPRPLAEKDWPRIRYQYEHTEMLNREICAEHRISTTTLNNRARQWGWVRRRQTVPAEGPPPAIPPAQAPPLAAPPDADTDFAEPSPHLFAPPAAPVSPRQIAQHLQSAITRVLTAIDAALAGLSAASSPREIERAGRAVAALTRTLHELTALQAQSPAFDAANDRGPENDDDFVRELIERMDGFAVMHAGKTQP
jgi:hypothetical protein